MSALVSYFHGCDDEEKKGNEIVDDEDDDIGPGVRVLQSPHFASVMLDACVLSEGVCWLISTL